MTNATYQTIPIQECGEPLIDLATFPFVLDPKYYQLGLSDTPRLYSRKGVIEKLLKIQECLSPKGLRFKIWDPWRSRQVQNNIYQKCWKEQQAAHPDWNDEKLREVVGVFVSAATDPARIPPHASGGAIDLTLVNSTGEELEMGTGFDHFGKEACMFHFDTEEPNSTISANRKLLREEMLKEGFSYYEDEWWHYDYGNQFWAYLTGRKVAIYGEISPPSC